MAMGILILENFEQLLNKSDRDEKSQQIFEFFKQMTKGSLKLGVRILFSLEILLKFLILI